MSVDYLAEFEEDYEVLQAREDLYPDDLAPTASMEAELKLLLFEAWFMGRVRS